MPYTDRRSQMIESQELPERDDKEREINDKILGIFCMWAVITPDTQLKMSTDQCDWGRKTKLKEKLREKR